MLIFGLSVGLYFMGFSPPLLGLMGEVGVSTSGTGVPMAETLINSLFSIFTNPTVLTALAVTAIAGFLTSGTNGQNIMFLVPIMIIVVGLDLFVLPMNFILSSDVPLEIGFVLFTFLNLMMMLTIMEFVRGSA